MAGALPLDRRRRADLPASSMARAIEAKSNGPRMSGFEALPWRYGTGCEFADFEPTGICVILSPCLRCRDGGSRAHGRTYRRARPDADFVLLCENGVAAPADDVVEHVLPPGGEAAARRAFSRASCFSRRESGRAGAVGMAAPGRGWRIAWFSIAERKLARGGMAREALQGNRYHLPTALVLRRPEGASKDAPAGAAGRASQRRLRHTWPRARQ